jgi:hypothetical protein
MSFKWENFLDLAKTLAKTADDDASLRSAVSRSYYCAFNLARRRAEANGYRHPKDDATGSHDLIWELYGRNDDPGCVRLASIGPRLKRRRVKADYRLYCDKLSDDVQDAIADAEECITLLSRLEIDLPKDVPRIFRF